MLGTASFDVADTEHSGTWTKGTVFAIDRGDRILIRIIGEMAMGDEDPFGISIGTAPRSGAENIVQRTEHITNPQLKVVSAYLDTENKSTSPRLEIPHKGEITIGFTYIDTYRAVGGGTFVVDFETNSNYDLSENKIDLLIKAGLHHTVVTVHLQK